jgi:hypothetical protein
MAVGCWVGDGTKYLSSTSTSILASGATAMSLSMWVKFNSLPSALKVIGRFYDSLAGPANGISVDIEGSNYADCRIYAGSSNDRENADVGQFSTAWKHLAITWTTGEAFKIYLNNAAAVTGAVTMTATDGAIDEIYILGQSGFAANCRVAHVAYWDKALTSGEVTQLYNNSGSTGLSPADVASANLKFYLYDSLTVHTGGLTLTENGGTVSYDTADYPAVAAPSGGSTTRGAPFGNRSTAFNGGRVFHGPIN